MALTPHFNCLIFSLSSVSIVAKSLLANERLVNESIRILGDIYPEFDVVSLIYPYVFFISGFYADMGLQVYYVIISDRIS